MVTRQPNLYSYTLRPQIERIPAVFFFCIFLWFAGISFFTLLTGYVLVSSFATFRRWRLWNRESIDITEDKIIWRRGTLFQKDVTEIETSKITVIQREQSYIQRVLFNTQTLNIYSAGHTGTSLQLQDISEDISLFSKPEPKRHSFNPSAAGIILGGLQSVLQTSLNIALVGTGIFYLYTDVVMQAVETIQQMPAISVTVGSCLALYLLQKSIPILDTLSRTYHIHETTITKSGGVFTTVYQEIKRNEITDVSVTQSFFERLVDISSVVVSCRGKSSKILFPYLTDPTVFLSHIEPQEDNEVQCTEKPDTVRSLLPLAISVPFVVQFPFLLLIFFPSLFSMLKPFRTKYRLLDRGIEESYSLFGTGKELFTYTEITGIRRRKSFLDWLFSTYTIDIWSYGSTKPLIVQHIKEEQFWNALKQSTGFEETQGTCVRENFSINAFLQMAIPYIFFLGVLAGFVSWRLTIPGFAMLCIYCYYEWKVSKTRRVATGPQYESAQGGIFSHKTFVKKEAVQAFHQTNYPLSRGSISFVVAGFSQSQPNIPVLSRRTPLKLRYVEPHQLKQVYHPSESPQRYDVNVLSVFLSTLLPSTILYVVLTAISVLLSTSVYSLPVTGAYIMYAVGKSQTYRYVVDNNHITKSKGILYRETTTIAFDDVDHIETQRNWCNSITNTESVYIYTNAQGAGDIVFSNTSHKLGIAINERLNM